MTVLCTGPESSGTRLLSRIVATGAEAVHHSMPHGGGGWWSPAKAEYDRAVVIVRDAECTALSAVAARHVPDREHGLANRASALGLLAELSPALWVSYEGLIAAPDGWLSVVSAWLGVDLELPEPLIDGNEKWRSA